MIPAMATAEPKPRLTPAEYLAIERASETRHEYYDGEMFAMTGGTFAHATIATNLASLLHGALRGGPCRALVSDMRVKVESAELYTYPDVVVVCGPAEFDEKEPKDTLLNPTVLIEVLSPSTEAYDRGRKFAFYRAIPSLREVLFVAQDRPLVERFTRTEAGDWLLHVAEGIEAWIDLPSVGARLTLAEVYEGVLGP